MPVKGRLLSRGKHRIMTIQAADLPDLLDFAREINQSWRGNLDTLHVIGVGRFDWDGSRYVDTRDDKHTTP